MNAGAGQGGGLPRAKRLLFLLCLLLSVASVPAQAAPPPAAQPVAPSLTPIPEARPDSLRPDSLAARRAPMRADTTLIVKHHFNHRQQIIAGSAIMAGLAMVMVVMNNYNPRGF